MKKNYWLAAIALIIAALGTHHIWVTSGDTEPVDKADKADDAENGEIKFYDVGEQAPQFVSYYDSITLTPEQEKIKSDALSTMPAPCCNDYSMLTCCCPCILSKSVWGLSNFMITEKGYDAEQVGDAVSEWLNFTNEDGYAGDACYAGRCESPFEEDGCGGMEKMVLGAG